MILPNFANVDLFRSTLPRGADRPRLRETGHTQCRRVFVFVAKRQTTDRGSCPSYCQPAAFAATPNGWWRG
jgi:hypothetical protein